MASTGDDMKSAAIETHDTQLGNERANLGDGSNEVSSGEPRATDSEDTIDPAALGQALDALEAKKTKWWAYLATRDFWIVLLIGYVFLLLSSRWLILMVLQTSPCSLHYRHEYLHYST